MLLRWLAGDDGLERGPGAHAGGRGRRHLHRELGSLAGAHAPGEPDQGAAGAPGGAPGGAAQLAGRTGGGAALEWLRDAAGAEAAGAGGVGAVEVDDEQIRRLETERRELLESSPDPAIEKFRQLLRLRGIGENSAWLFAMEFFAWREFQNRRQVGALAGLTPTPYQSGGTDREQGISKAGNRQLRSWRSRSRGGGCATSARVRSRGGTTHASATAAVE